MVSALLGALTLYVLSVGPACYVIAKSGRYQPLVEKLYAPLVWAVQGTPLNSLLAAYAEFWLKLAGDSPSF